MTLGGSLKIKMRDPGIQSSIFNAENDGSIDFSINRKTSVQEISVFHVGIFDFYTPFSENKPNSSLHSKELLFLQIFVIKVKLYLTCKGEFSRLGFH